MSSMLIRWNTIIFIGQTVLLAVVAGMAYLTHASAQNTVLIGLLSIVVLTAMNTAGTKKTEMAIVFDLSISNACGFVAVFFLVLALINYGSVPANVATTCFIGGAIFLCASVAAAVSAARVAKTFGAEQRMWALVLAAAPLGIGPIICNSSLLPQSAR